VLLNCDRIEETWLKTLLQLENKMLSATKLLN